MTLYFDVTGKFGPPIPVHEKYKGVVPSKEVLQEETDALMAAIKSCVSKSEFLH